MKEPKKQVTRIKSFTHLIAAHPYQQAILNLAEAGKLDGMSLRAIAEAIGAPTPSPQIIKHHVSQMIRYGFLDIVGGKYQVGRILKK